MLMTKKKMVLSGTCAQTRQEMDKEGNEVVKKKLVEKPRQTENQLQRRNSAIRQ